MAVNYVCGFELNSLAIEFNTTTGAAMTVQTSIARSGLRAARVNGLSSGTRSGVFKQMNGGSNQSYCAYLYVATAPSAENRICGLANSVSSIPYYITLGNDLKLRLYNNGTLKATSSAISLNTWVRIEQAYTVGGSDTVTFSLDGTSVGSFADGASTTCTGFFLGGNGNAEAQTQGDWYWDDIAADSGSTTLPGAGSLVLLSPDGAGDFAEGALGGSSPAATGWQSVNSIPPADATKFWELQTDSSANSSSPDRLDVTCGDLSAGLTSAIQFVAVGVRAKPLTNASCSFVPRIKSQASGTIVEGTTTAITGTAFVTNDDTANTSFYKLIQTTDPQAGGAWTEALVNAMQIGVRAPDGAPNVDVSGLWAYVRYTPAVATGKGVIFPRRSLRFRR